MNFKNKIIFFLSLVFILNGCEQSFNNKNGKINLINENRYKNSGFALIDMENLVDIKSLEPRSLDIYHKSLKKNSSVKITNPKNGNFLIARVKSNRIKFSNFYNSVLSLRIAEQLEIDYEEPLVEIILISKNSTFVAKKAKTFDEERNVAEKAPIDGIKINDLNNSSVKKVKAKKEIFSSTIKIADFYYKETAQLMIERIKQETSIKNPKILKLSKTKYRVFLGPFDDIKDLKMNFEKIDSLNFENLEILRNV